AHPMRHICLAVALAACASNDPGLDDPTAETSPDEPFLVDGRALATIAEGSDEARGVLRAANLATSEELSSPDEVGLLSNPATRIVAYRNGPDGKPHTADDRTIETLKELDAIPWVGSRTFRHLLSWATAQGFTAPRSCTPG